MAAINLQNDEYKKGKYPIFLGEQLGLVDTINVSYPLVEKNYLQQRKQFWIESEVALDQSRKDFVSCSKNNYDVMIKNLSYQWAADSLAKSIITLFAPFITNNEVATALDYQSSMEIIHSRTYSEIIRQCIPDPEVVFDDIRKNKAIFKRLDTVEGILGELAEAGHRYSLGMIEKDDNLRLLLIKGLVALVALEGIQFMSSFSATFAMAEQQLFIGACKLIGKIMLDEALHSHLDLILIEGLLKEPEWKKVFDDNLPELKQILDDVVASEEEWASYLFSEGRYILGLNAELMREWLWYNATPIYRKLGIKYDFRGVKSNPLPWMDKWTNPDSVQTAAQEIQLTAYQMNVTSSTLNEDFDF